MCTLSLFPNAQYGVVLAMNRDESRARPLSTEMEDLFSGNVRMTFPVDPQGGGTWIGYNDVGLALAILNRTELDFGPRDRPYKSRGLIIPQLLAANNFENCVRTFEAMELSDYPPFALVFVDLLKHKLAVYEPHHGVQPQKWANFFLTSSSYRPKRVLEYREREFHRFIESNANADPGITYEAIKAFHLTQDPGHKDKSILMEREDSRTVSLSIIVLIDDEPWLEYFPIEL